MIISFDSTGIANEHFSKNIIYSYSGGSMSQLLDSRDGECLNTRKCEASVSVKELLSAYFGCGICEELLERLDELLEHCSQHRFSPHHDLVADLC